MTENNSTAQATTFWRLKGFYYAAQISGIITLAVVASVIYFKREYFTFFSDISLTLKLFVAIFILHTGLFILQESYNKKIFYILSRYLWVGFFLSMIYLTGGIASTFVFILMFPLITSATDLDARATRNIGITVTLLFGCMIFLYPDFTQYPRIIGEHIFRTTLFAIVAYYMYNIVKQTLLQKYEKEETKRKFSELVELDKVKTDFISATQHQLRTPLTAIRWGIDAILADQTLSKESRDLATDLAKEGNISMSILNQLLQTSEVGVEGFKLEQKEIDLNSLINTILESIHNLVRQKNVTTVYSEVSGAIILGDRAGLMAALTNVFDNAVRYSPNGKVIITLGVVASRVVLTVKDSGIGITADDLNHIFDRFYRGQNATLLEPSETGVGLYITKKIIELHRGTVELSSELNKGTTVTISLPAKV